MMSRAEKVQYLALLEEKARRAGIGQDTTQLDGARINFSVFRRYMDPRLISGWWLHALEAELQRFYVQHVERRRPKLVVQAPPQHGKSFAVSDFIHWLLGVNPELRVIFASYSDRLGIRTNLRLQRAMTTPQYQSVFPRSVIPGEKGTEAGKYLRNQEIVELPGHAGYFRNTTVRGAVTGESLDIGIIDDPMKGRAEASSVTTRSMTWDWLTDDFMTRFSEFGSLLMVTTRWHVDDPAGRLLARYGDAVRVFSFPAVAEVDEPHRKQGEALFPELKSIEFLDDTKRRMSSFNFAAVYQQRPVVLGGEIIKTACFKRYRELPPMLYRMVFGDTAQKTSEANDFSVLECWGAGRDGGAYLIDLVRGRWLAPELKRRTLDFWQKHAGVKGFGALRQLVIEDKASGTGLIQEIRSEGRIPVQGLQRDKDKFTRLQDVLGFIEAGYVWLPDDAPWVSDFILECENFTATMTHAHDDQIDPMIDALVSILGGRGRSIYDAL